MPNRAYRVRVSIERTCPNPTQPWEEIDAEILAVYETSIADPAGEARITFERVIEEHQRRVK